MAEDQHVVYGEEPPYTIPQMSLGEFILQQLQARQNTIAQVQVETGEALTFPQMLSRSIVIAEHMRQLGIRPGDVVGISSENNLDFCLPALATLYVGATLAPFNPTYKEGELLHTMSICQPRMIYATASTISMVSHASQKLDCVRDIILIGRDLAPPEFQGYKKITEFLLKPIGDCRYFTPARVNPRDTAVILCSSGTTGLPKGVELTHHNFLIFLQQMMHNATGSFKSDDVLPGMLPFFHGYGFGLLLISITLGLKVVVLTRFEESMFLQIIQDYKMSTLFLVPPLVVFLGKHPIVDKYDLSHAKTIICGAAPLSKEAQDAVTKRLGIEDIRQGYGMTETTILATSSQTGEGRVGSSGKVVWGTAAKIIDLETGKSLPRNAKGEICFKGPTVMKGYRGNPTATMEAIDQDGWLHTGDIGYFDDDGHLFVVDRLKELIKYMAFQVAPAELEAILQTHKEIRDAGVVGIKDDISGELPLAFVVRQPNSTITEKEVMDYVADRVSPPKKLRGGVRFVSEIPRNPSGKILRRELRSKL